MAGDGRVTKSGDRSDRALEGDGTPPTTEARTRLRRYEHASVRVPGERIRPAGLSFSRLHPSQRERSSRILPARRHLPDAPISRASLATGDPALSLQGMRSHVLGADVRGRVPPPQAGAHRLVARAVREL